MSVRALDNFPWPRPPGTQASPVWRDNAFIVGRERRRVLEFETADSHWSSELTTFHQEEAGVDHPIDRASRRLAVESLRRFVVTATPIILDVGCSSGYLLKDIHEALPNAALIGSDYILPPLMRLAEEMPALPVLQFDLRSCPLPDNCIDAVTVLNVLEHIDRDEEALAQIYRILRPGGIAHIEVPSGPQLFDIYDEHMMHHRRYRLRDLKAMARRLEFQVLKATHLGALAYPGFWIVKKNNRRLRSRVVQSSTRVRQHIRDTRASTLMAALMRLELTLSHVMNFPFGIRSVLLLRKTAGHKDSGSGAARESSTYQCETPSPTS